MEPSYTVQRLEYSPLLRALDAACGAARISGLPLTSLEPGSILAAARRRTGLQDWGDEGFLEPMSRLISGLDEAAITPLGRASARQTFIKAVANRLWIEEYVRRSPGLLEAPITRPVFILGFPRTGTTLLQNLLSLHPGMRALQFWELFTPYPVHPDPGVDQRRRLRMARTALRAAYLVAPEQRYIHRVEVSSLEECWLLFYNTFAAMNFDLQSGLRSFGDWLMGRDMSGPYREYYRYLQVLSRWKATGQFVLKCPEHLWFLDALLQVFPDACVVWTHRDPVDCVASYSSLISLNHRMWYGRFEPRAVGAYVEDRFLSGVNRAMESRARSGREGQFLDVDFVELSRDPAAMLRRIQDYFGLPRSEEHDRAARAWLAEEREDSRGSHSYSPAQFGLDPAQIRRRYSNYIERFSVPLSGSERAE